MSATANKAGCCVQRSNGAVYKFMGIRRDVTMLYDFFWVLHRRLNFKFQLFRTLSLHGQVGMKMEQTQCSEMLAFKLQTPGNHPEESIQQSPSLSSMVCYGMALNFVIHSVENKSSIYRSDPNILNHSYTSYLPAYEDGTDTVFRNVGI
jgi:hypothetical protein